MGTEVVPFLGNLVPAWTMTVFFELKSDGNLTAPEAFVMLPMALILDAMGFILFLASWLGVDDYGVLDIIGMLVIGGWMLVRSSLKSELDKAQE